jgi:vitamin B12 transporter
MRTIFLLSLSLAATAGETSNVQGTIVDLSGRLVEGARVSCQNRATYSNTEGRFNLAGIDKCEARIEKAGFLPQTVLLSTKVEIRVTIAVAGPVTSVVVSATRTETTPEQAAVAASVVPEERLVALGYPMLSDIFRDIPGLQISQYGRRGALAQVYTRGAERTGTLVLLDGVPLNDPGGELHLEHLTSEGVDRVEVVRGPESALFGAEAAASVIQIFTKRGDTEDKIPHGSMSYERGNFQTDRWIASLTGGFASRLDYSLSAAELHTAGAYQNDFYRDNTGTANLGFRISSATQLRGVFHEYDGHVGTPGQVAYGVDDLFAHQQTRDSTVSLRLDDSRGSNYLQRFSFGFNRLSDRFDQNEPSGTQPLAAYVRDASIGTLRRVYFVKLLNPFALPATSEVPSGLRLVRSTRFFGTSNSLNLTERKAAGYQGTLAHRSGVVVFGYDFQNQSGNLSGTAVSRDHHGFFANLQQNVGSRLYLSGGARLEHSTAFGNIGVGRGGASFVLLREHGPLLSASLRFSAGRGVTEPSLLQNFARSTFFHGNPLLQPERTTTYEAGVVTEWLNRRLRTEVTAFRNSFHNLIAFVGDSWQNVQASWARGLETSVEARLPGHVLIATSYMRLYTRITNSVSPASSTTGIGQELVRRPRNSGAISIALTPRRWSLVIGGRFVGERQDADFTFGTTRNPGYEHMYASGSYQAGRHLAPFLRVDNLLNERYEEVLGYQTLSRSVIGGVRIHW